ncbi:dihydrolipoamide acetyltransferase family protein [Actinoplanes sp. NPDC051851]|uniref:dihydrolipoamide acetyltransferase family protein n=1 Tax=Actinoplanes sp. NPDC051851 TaxID=3154753 RepID=UPI003419FEED
MIFNLPDLGEGLTEAEIVQWLVAEGDEIARDQPVVEVETAKAVVEVPSPYAGRVATLHATAGSTLAVGAPLISVAEPAADTGSGNVLIGYGTSAAGVSGRKRRPRVPVQPSSHTRPPQVVSPLVRTLARSTGVDLATVTPTGRGGVITRADVERAAASVVTPVAASPVAAPPVAAPPSAGSPVTVPPPGSAVLALPESGETRVPLSGFRKAAAVALGRSRAEIPEATVWVDVDATELWRLRESNPDGPGLLAYLARFTIAGLREFPVLNARFDGERQEIVELATINLGIAVQGKRGLLVPSVLDAGRLTTRELSREIRRLTAAAREGRVSERELSEGTFTLNNYGSLGVDGSAAIINHPQVAILGFGRILDRPWVVGGELCVRKITQMSFVFDHRVCDGGTAAGFMRTIADAIENPPSVIARL